MTVTRMTRGLLVLAAVLGLGGCSSNSTPVALSRTEGAGRVVFVVVPCQGASVRSIQLWSTRTDRDGFFARDRLLWRVDNDGTTTTERFVTGPVPPGFREVVPLTQPVEGELMARVKIDGATWSHEQYFDLDELQTGTLQRGDRAVTIEELRDEAKDCGDTPLGGDAELWIGATVLGGMAWVALAGAGVGIAALVARRRRRGSA